jgi:hypothetical protein
MRTFVKVLLVVSCMVLAAGFTYAAVKGDLYEIPKTVKAPVIDANLDPVWLTQDDNFQGHYANGASEPDGLFDLMGYSRLMWDNDFIYGFFYTQDDILVDEHTDAYQRDGWELYFDADNSKGTTAANGTDYDGVNDIQLRMNHGDGNDASLMTTGFPVPWASGEFWAMTGWDRAAAGVKVAVKDTALGFCMEWQIPMSSLYLDPTPETLIGFELQQNDNDSDTRNHISKWWLETGDISWNNAASFGTAVLSGRAVGEEFVAAKASAAPVIDGVLDDVWVNEANVYSNNFYVNGASEPDDYSDLYGNTRLLWDATNIYGFWQVTDDIIIDEHADDYQEDGMECYFDADNSKGSTAANGADFDGVNDIQIRLNHVYGTDVTLITTGAPVPWAAGEFWAMTGWDRAAAGVKMAVTDQDFGYQIEWQMPLETLYLDTTPGTQFGWETQINDNDSDTRNHISHWWIQTGDPSWNNASTWGTAVFQNSKSILAVKEKNVVPSQYELAQNFPNPFNPTTTIAYGLKNSGKVRLSVFDIMGKEVAVLVDGSQAAGSHQVQFNASNLSTGMYFYKLQTADQVFTKKMTLVK